MIWVIVLALIAGFALFMYKMFMGFAGRPEEAPRVLPEKDSPWYEFTRDYFTSVETVNSAAHENLVITSDDGWKLRGKLFRTRPDNDHVVIGFHGYQGSAEADILRFSKMYEHAGYDYLAISERAQNDSEGKYVTFGVKEAEDGILWCREIRKLYGEDVTVLIHGVSMGAATVLLMSADPDLPENVKAVISDCAYDSMMNQAMHTMSKYPAGVLDVMLGIMDLYAKVFAGFRLKDAAPVKVIPGSRIPCLFVHGDLDDFVPRNMMDTLYKAYGGPKDFFTVKDAVHSCAFSKDPEGYEKKFMSFLEQHKLLSSTGSM